MNQVLIALCSLTNLAGLQNLGLLGQLSTCKFFAGYLTLRAYGIERADSNDPVTLALMGQVLTALDGNVIPAREIASLMKGSSLTMIDAEIIYAVRNMNFSAVACDSELSASVFKDQLSGLTLLNSLDLLSLAIEQGQLSVQDAIGARALIDSKTGVLPESKNDYFIGPCN